jgi:hypothetical protein
MFGAFPISLFWFYYFWQKGSSNFKQKIKQKFFDKMASWRKVKAPDKYLLGRNGWQTAKNLSRAMATVQ